MKAIVLLSGGMDSAVILAKALEQKRRCIALSFDYGQRHRIELDYAEKIVRHYDVEHKLIKLDPASFAKSALVGDLEVPKDRNLSQIAASGVPSTYVPARNTLFIAFAIAHAEIAEAQEIYAGPNLLDQPGYPDCRPVFYEAFQDVVNLATRQAIEGRAPRLITPLIFMDKKAIVKEGLRLKVPFDLTFSCYDPGDKGKSCLRCDACRLRVDAFN